MSNFPALAFALILTAAGTGGRDIAAIVKHKGAVEWKSPDSEAWTGVSKGLLLASGTMLKTGDNGLAIVKFLVDGSMLRMKPKTKLTIAARDDKRTGGSEASLDAGAVLFNIKPQQRKGGFHVKTPTGVATVKGTDFWVIVDGDSLCRIVALSGELEVKHVSAKGKKRLGGGSTAVLDSKGISTRPTTGSDLPAGEKTETLEIRFKDPGNSSRKLRIELDTSQ